MFPSVAALSHFGCRNKGTAKNSLLCRLLAINCTFIGCIITSLPPRDYSLEAKPYRQKCVYSRCCQRHAQSRSAWEISIHYLQTVYCWKSNTHLRQKAISMGYLLPGITVVHYRVLMYSSYGSGYKPPLQEGLETSLISSWQYLFLI